MRIWRVSPGLQEITVQGRQLVKQTAEVNPNLMLLGACFWSVRYDAVRRLLYERMMAGCESYGTLLAVPVEMVIIASYT